MKQICVKQSSRIWGKHGPLSIVHSPLSIILCLLLGTAAAMGQDLVPLSYQSYMEKVIEGNKGYAAGKLNVSVADAELTASKVFNDPSLSVEYGYNDDKNLQMGQSVAVELSKTFTVGKRSANINLAGSQKELEIALLEDYFHSLRAEATLAYLEALKQAELYKVKENTYEQVRRLAEADSVKYALGEIGQTDALQTKLEANLVYNEILQAKTELHNAFAALELWTGVSSEALSQPAGNLHAAPRVFDVSQLVQTALENRADLAAALKNVDVAQKALKVAKRERNTDFDLALGYNYNTEVRNEIAPAPKFSGLTVGVSVPLKFSNVNKGAVRAAEFRMKQAQYNYEQAELEVRNSVMQSLRAYISLEEQAKRYGDGLLKDAQTVMEGKIYSYNRGETSLLEALDARRTYDDVHTGYIETLFNVTAALIALERNAGIWDISFN